MIPALAEIMDGLLAAQGSLGALRERLRQEQQRIALVGGGVIDREAWRADRAELERLGAEVKGAVEEVARLGGIVKDLEAGLVDFPGLREGEVVNLCWKYGEREIRYWHGLDEGYAARKPL